MESSTYILIGSTNPYLAQRNGWCSTTIAIRAEYGHRGLVEGLMQEYCVSESDNYIVDEHGNVVRWDSEEIILPQDDLIYEHDGKVYEFVAIEDLTEEQAKATLRDGVLFDEQDRESIYAMYPDLAPVVEADEE